MTTERIDIVIREDGSRVVRRNIRDIGDEADVAGRSLDKMKGILAGLAAGGIVASLIKMADTYTNIQNKLRLVTSGTENLARVTKELQGIANSTRSDFESTAELYARLANSGKELGLSQERLLKFTKTLNQAIVLSGASAEEAAGGLRQLSQGLASGALRGDELNSVMENFPKVADIIAQGLGVTRGELRKLGADGKISATSIIDAFEKAEVAVGRDFATTIPTVSQSLAVLKNNFLIFIGQLDQATGVSATFSKFILTLSENLDTLIPVLAGIGVAIALAFAPGIIASFAGAISSLFALIAANPLGALALAIAGVLTALYLMRDQIKLGIDDTTTLGDLLRAAFESVGPVISELADFIKNVLGFITEEFSNSAKMWAGFVGVSINEQEGTFISLVRTVAQAFDLIGAVIRGVLIAAGKSIGIFVGQAVMQFEKLGQIAGNVFSGEFGAAVDGAKAYLSNGVDAFKEIGSVWGESLSQSILDQADGGLESVLDGLLNRAKEISKERLSAAKTGGLDPAAPGGRPPVPVDADAAKKAARELEKLKTALQSVLDASDPVGAATRRLAEDQDVLTRATTAGLITQKEAAAAYANLSEMMADQLDPLGALNRELDENIRLSKLSAEQRQIESDLLSFTKQLRQDGVKLTQSESEALRAKLVVEQQLAKIAQARDQLQGNSIAAQIQDFQAQVEGMKQLLADAASGFGSGDVAAALNDLLPWANLEGTQEQMTAYVELHQQMYDQIKALEDASIINSKTAGMLRNQADLNALNQRLSYTRQFFGALAQLSTSENRKLAQIGKAAAIVQATIDGVLAVQKTMAETPYPYNIPLAGAQAVIAAANVAQIASTGFRTGGEMTVGGSGGPDSQTVAFRATPGEKISVNTPSQARAIENGGQAPAPVVPVTIINVDDPNKAIDAMDTSAGKNVIMNHMQSDPAAFKRALGMS